MCDCIVPLPFPIQRLRLIWKVVDDRPSSTIQVGFLIISLEELVAGDSVQIQDIDRSAAEDALHVNWGVAYALHYTLPELYVHISVGVRH